MSELQLKWDAIYTENTETPKASEVLLCNQHLLPTHGNALDLACGLGGNALFLAQQGLQLEAWDISGIALAKLGELAQKQNLPITTHQCLITADLLPKNQFDVIVISRFLDRSLCNAIMAALKTEGLLFYQTFTRNKVDQQGPSNPVYLLDCNELLRLFSPLNLIFYQEFGRTGNLQHGNRNEASYIGQKLNRY
jgi:SAM-dependent methyltransferase